MMKQNMAEANIKLKDISEESESKMVGLVQLVKTLQEKLEKLDEK